MTQTINKRLVIFATGLDPAGTRRYHLFLKKQARTYHRRFGPRFKVGPYEPNDRAHSYLAKCTLEAEWPEGNCEVDYRWCDWRDMSIEESSQSSFLRNISYLYWYCWLLPLGAPKVFGKGNWPPAIVFSIPLIYILISAIVLLGLPAFGAALALQLNANIWLGAGLGMVFAIPAFLKIRKLFDGFYTDHIAHSFSFKCKTSVHGNKDLQTRIATVFQETLAAISETKPDEVLIVAHSFGVLFSVPLHLMLLKHFENDEEQRPQISHIAIGSTLSVVTANKKERFYRQTVAELFSRKDAIWYDYYAPQDPLNIASINPVEDYGLADRKIVANYRRMSAKFGEIFARRKLNSFKYNPLRMHMQYVMANDIEGDYDFLRIITRPRPLTDNISIPKNDR